jgi:putative transposase
MKRVAGRQTRYVNKLEKRTGSLWEGRYKSSPICTNEYLLACCRYIELNPVRAGIVANPEEYRWSTYCIKIGENNSHCLDFDPCYLALADSQADRECKYAEWVRKTIPAGELEQIRLPLQRGQLTGSKKFVDEIEKKLEIRVEFRGQGRPKIGIK